MYTLTEPEFFQQAKPFLRQVFLNDNQFTGPFAPNILGRKIIFPCDGCLESPLIDAIIFTAEKIGDTGCYISLLPTEYPYKPSNKSGTCYIPLSEFISVYSGMEEENIEKSSHLAPDETKFQTMFIKPG
ncbi:hypothetical protein, partial [Crocosphaera sp. Alani8]|uniref:hypothetical protein n=1 Tax=Crocosphaera sp. Alani8 TaxID=3038952 RepID=UPI00313C4E9F